MCNVVCRLIILFHPISIQYIPTQYNTIQYNTIDDKNAILSIDKALDAIRHDAVFVHIVCGRRYGPTILVQCIG